MELHALEDVCHAAPVLSAAIQETVVSLRRKHFFRTLKGETYDPGNAPLLPPELFVFQITGDPPEYHSSQLALF
jgi:hypothetical protein